MISKATTQDKINRIQALTINGILEQNDLTDEDYELYVRITDELTDAEFIYLYKLIKGIPQGAYEYKDFRPMYETVKQQIQEECGYSDDKILYIRNSLVGCGLLDYVLTYGGNAVGSITDTAYSYIKYIELGVNTDYE
ncbi:MAG: hypothetical protein BHW64_02735 [Candidatus Melainabacteria bacterium LEY3_CP_29_8]|nr:MAG: hypothetical protein BHW64_02735 [Candidatus Melainabacteria bacterium LEY3_CP_29_8]